MNVSSVTDSPFQIKLSFEPYIEFLETKMAEDEEYVARYQHLLERIEEYPALRDGLESEAQINELLPLIGELLQELFPKALSPNEIKAVSIPYQKIIINPTERFKSLIHNAGSDFSFGVQRLDDQFYYILSCCLILNEYYNTQLDFKLPLVVTIPTKAGIDKHYKILYNADFLNIYRTEASKTLSDEDIRELIDNSANIDLWKKRFPPQSWILKGFGLINLVDITLEYSVSLLKERLLSFDIGGIAGAIAPVFEAIYQTKDIDFGFSRYSEVDDHLRLSSFGVPVKSFLIPETLDVAASKVLCADSYEALIVNQSYFTVSDTEAYVAARSGSSIAQRIQQHNIGSFILVPIVKDGELLGVLEVVSPVKYLFNSLNARRIDAVVPFLSDSIKRMISEVQNRIQAFIQNHFTSIHSSVYWKFRNEALHHIFKPEDSDIEPIVFNDVYPLFGQSDINGSSGFRNLSVQRDLIAQLSSLRHLILTIQKDAPSTITVEMQQELDAFSVELQNPLLAGTEQKIKDYLSANIHPILRSVNDPALKELVSEYFSNRIKESGVFYTHRRKYEQSVAMVNNVLANTLDTEQKRAQHLFPHYYERFKTDGVDFNLYVGASIAERATFSIEKLHELRKWQLRTIVKMERAHYQMKGDAPYQLEIASLILAFAQRISVRFRMDEKRLDVDGTYNARYEIVKKRIDKAHIRNSDERITSKGKLTIVFSTISEEHEYKAYLETLIDEGLFSREIEVFDVEELQGVSGLRAMRIPVVYL